LLNQLCKNKRIELNKHDNGALQKPIKSVKAFVGFKIQEERDKNENKT